MIVCSANGISKMYGGNLVFDNLSIEIHEQSRIGLVGRNGSGKSTLFKLLAGIETPDKGQIHWQKELNTGYLAQIPEYPEELEAKEILKFAFSKLLEIENDMKTFEEKMSVETNPDTLQNLVEKYGRLQEKFAMGGGYEIEANIDRIANGLQIHSLLSTPFGKLSGGEKTKIGLGIILLKNPGLLLLDEPTNHLDLLAVEWLGNFLKKYNGTVVVISHDRYFLDEVVNQIFDLEDGEIQIYHTNYSLFVKEKEERLLREFQAYQEQQKKIKKMKEAIKRLKEWANQANPPNEALHKRARNMERALERMEKLNRPMLNRKKMNLQLDAADRSGNDVVVLSNISKSFDKQLLFKEINMHIQYQERVAIVGENGTGKSTMLKILLNDLKPDEGEVRIGSNVKIGYLSQHVYDQLEEKSVLEAFRDEVPVNEGDARNILARFLFYGYDVFRSVNQLSGGERMRLRLAQLMYQDINLLILDEPTNHLDIESREVLEETLEDFNGTLLTVSHDRYFLNKLFQKIYWIKDTSLYQFIGDYNNARERIDEISNYNKAVHVEAEIIKKPYPKKGQDETNIKNSKIMDTLESQIKNIENEINEIDAKMLVENDLMTMQQLYDKKSELELENERLYEKLDRILEM